MGFGTVAAQIIFFIAVIMIASAFIIGMNDQMQQNSQSLRTQNERLSEQLLSDISIMSLTYNSSNDELRVYVRNSGKTRLELNATDIFVNGIRIARAQRTIEVESDTSVGNEFIWDPSEIVLIQTTQALSSSIHTIRIVADNEASDQDIISP